LALTAWMMLKTNRPVPSAADPDESVYLPGRNLLLSAKLGVLCALEKIHTIAIGSLDGNPFPDATPVFYRELGRVLSMGLDLAST